MLSLGIANELVDKNESMESVVDKWTTSILKAAPIAVKMAKQAVQASENSSLEAGLVTELKCETVCFSTNDCKVGFKSFLERKQPIFKGE
jgi:enoyl-CoA hydratase/carnithine racemase